MDNKTGFMIVMERIPRREFPAVEIGGCASGGMDMGLKKIGIIANTDKKDAVECTLELRGWLMRRGVEVVLEEEIARATGMTGGIPGKDLPEAVELIAVLGGDGTLLSAARTIAGHEVPLMGINLGGFGFMTVINLNEMYPAMEEILKGRFRTSKRMMLETGFPGSRAEKPVPPALNDVVINRGNLSRMIHLETFVDDRYLATFKADGLVLATPTGSTAYSLSAGGPIVFPELQSIILNPICPHTLTNRPMMLPPDAAIRVVLWTKEECATLTIDGQISHVIRSGEAIEVRKSRTLVHLVDSPSRSYLEVVRTKLGWGGLP
jgi:NAD+ kinase